MARPKKQPEEKRDDRIEVRLTARERAEMDHRAALYGMTAADLVRHRVLDWRLPASVAARQHRAQVASALIRLGTNLNQVVHHMNAGRTGPIDGLVELLARIDDELNRLIDATPDSDYD